MYNKYLFSFSIFCITFNFDFVNCMDMNSFKRLLFYPQWIKLKNGLHIIDGKSKEITMDQLFDGFGTSNFITSENLNEKARHFYLLLSCNLSMRLLTYTDLLSCNWTEYKKLDCNERKLKKEFVISEFKDFTNFIVDWSSEFYLFKDHTKLKFKNNLKSYIHIVDNLASYNIPLFGPEDKNIDKKMNELYSNVRDFMSNNCRPIQPILSNTIKWYNKCVDNEMSPKKIMRQIKGCLTEEKLKLMEMFWKLGFWSKPKGFSG